MAWKFLSFDVALPHFCSEGLVDAVVANMRARGAELLRAVPSTHFSIDKPGVVALDRPHELFDVDGATVEIPCEDVGSFAAELAELRERPSPSGPYVKLHGFLRCWVLTLGERDRVRELLRERVPFAERRADVFEEQHRRTFRASVFRKRR